MAQTLKVETLQMRNDTAANWNSKNPVLAKGEMGVEIDTKKFKFGDGITKWQELSYASSNEYDLPTATTSTLGGVKSQAAGTDKVVVASDGTMSVSEVTTATKLKTARSITLSGDVSGSASFDGSAAVAIQANLRNSGVTAGTYTKVTVDAKGRVTTATNLSESDIPNLSTSKITGIGTAATKNVGSAAGNVPMLNESGKLDESILPALAITEPHVVDNQEEMLALEAQTGDVAVRTDGAGSFILKQSPASVLDNWIQLRGATAAVLSVNGKTGAVTLTTSDIAEGSKLYYTDKRATTNFNTNIAKTKVESLSDGVSYVKNSDTFILNCGNA